MDLVEGVDFITHVRTLGERRDGPDSGGRTTESAPTMRALPRVSPDAPSFDEPKLRAALRQLVEALAACHASGFVHRDVKPSNVLVTPAGKVVVLDFGLVSDTRSDESTQAVVGTPIYMAPEQAASGAVGPEADLYAVGVMLYEALTGRVPIEGAALQVMLRKQSEKPAAPREVAAGVPPDLDALCLALLRFSPADRPMTGAVLRVLGDARAPAGDDESRSRTLTPPFVGREEELAALASAFAESRAQAVCAVVEGESGVGKSRLVRRFTERVSLEDSRALVLFGRCYERESVPYKALDGVVDALARFLARLPDAEARALLPARPAALVQVFPVLRRVAGIAAQVRDAPLAIDPFELRNRAFAALREMFVRVAEQRPMVVVIDDAQWADDDSHTMLAEILREPDAPRVLLVATVRWSGEGIAADASVRASAIGRLERTMGPRTRTITLKPLPAESSLELATLLLQGYGARAAADAATIATDAGGHPLFIDILARRSARTESATSAASGLQAALHAVVAELDPDARTILEIVSLAEAPLPIRVVAAAAAEDGLGGGESFVRALQKLRVSRLVVGTGVRGDDLLEPYHDRVRAAVTRALLPERWVERFRRIAMALETSGGSEPGALAFYWSVSGDSARSSRYSTLAGDRAAEGLAFDRAARFYEDALGWPGLGPEERRKLRAKLGDALANAGRGKDAAHALREAAEGAPAAESLDLRRRAAEQLLRSGHYDEGAPALDKVLRSVGIRLPSSPGMALVYMALLRALLALRGWGYRKRDATQIAQDRLIRVDTCYAAAIGLAMSDMVRGAALQARGVLEALRLGEPYRVARALAADIAFVGARGRKSWPLTEKLIEHAGHLANEVDHPLPRGMVAMDTGIALWVHGRYSDALESFDRGIALLREYGRDVSWETASGEICATYCLAYMGRLRALRERVSRCLPEMDRRGDLYGAVNLRIGWPNIACLMDDDVREARNRIEYATASWSRRGYHYTHYAVLLGRTNLGLYVGDIRDAYPTMSARWRAFSRSMMGRFAETLRMSALDAHARAALAVAAIDRASRPRLLRGCMGDVRRLFGVGSAPAHARALLLRAGVAYVRSDRGGAVRILSDALRAFTALDQELHAAVVRSVLASLVGGDEGRALRAEADAWFASQGVKRPDRFVAIIAPGFETAS